MKTLVATSILALAVVACGGSGITAAPTSGTAASPAPASTAPSAASAAASTAVVVKDFTLDPLDVAVAGTVSLAVTNDGPTVHNVAIRDDAGAVLGTTADLKEGESETLTVEIPAGSYILFCTLPGHESLGIKGTLTVSE